MESYNNEASLACRKFLCIFKIPFHSKDKIYSVGQQGDFPFATCLQENAGIDFNSRGSSAP